MRLLDTAVLLTVQVSYVLWYTAVQVSCVLQCTLLVPGTMCTRFLASTWIGDH